MDHIRYDLSQNLPHPVDAQSTEELEFQLGIAADNGEMPSFSDPGSRSGYALDFLPCRVRRLSDTLLMKGKNEPLAIALQDALRVPGERRVVSIGGGPGYDHIGLCLVAAFLKNNGESAPVSTLQSVVFDYEFGWGDIVHELDLSTNRILNQIGVNEGSSCSFGGRCDITKGMDDPVNHACRDTIDSTNIFVCQYCVAENANQLRDSQYVFFENLFHLAGEGALFFISEATHRLWPDFVNLIGDGGFDVAFVKNRSHQLLIRKREGAIISPEVREQCSIMQRDGEMHSIKVQNGYARQAKKIRGAK
jgi:hypothetical protein